MTEEERWAKVRQIVREENEDLEKRILAALGKSKTKLALVNGRWTGITEEQMTAWSEAFPAVEIDAELKKMAAWIVSNPMLAPKNQIGRFVNTWLTKVQNQKSLRSIPALERPTETKMKLCSYCEQIAKAQVNGIWYCAAHTDDAYDRRPIPHMRGVTAKPVAGNDA